MLFANPDLHPKDAVLAAYRKAAGRQKERYHIVLLSLQGEGCERISAIVMRRIETVRKWLNRYNDGGLEGLDDAPIPGRPSTLTPEEQDALRTAVDKGPQAYGLKFPNWTCKSLSWWLHRTYGKDLSQERVRTLLHQLGCSLTRPRHQLLKASAEEKKAFWGVWRSGSGG